MLYAQLVKKHFIKNQAELKKIIFVVVSVILNTKEEIR